MREGLRLREQREQEDKAKLKWLRGAADEGFEDAVRGDYVSLRSDREIDSLVDRMRQESNRRRRTPQRKVRGEASKRA